MAGNTQSLPYATDLYTSGLVQRGSAGHSLQIGDVQYSRISGIKCENLSLALQEPPVLINIMEKRFQVTRSKKEFLA